MAYRFQAIATDGESDSLVFSIENQPDWAEFDRHTGELSGVPRLANVGITSGIVIGVSDGTTISELLPFSIEVRPRPNSPPTISGRPASRALAGAAYIFQPEATDADQDALTFEIVGRPSWAVFDTATGRLSGIPNESHIGTSGPITINASDGKSNATLAAFFITVERSGSFAVPTQNRPPSIAAIGSARVVANSVLDLVPIARDPEDDPLVFSIQNRPRWASFDSSTGRLAGTPARTDAGIATGIVIVVSDGSASSATSPFSIEVTLPENRAPRISGEPRSLVTVGERYDFTPAADDPDGDSLTFSVIGRPAWARFDNRSGRLWGMPERGDVGRNEGLVIAVSDGTTSSEITPFTIDVRPAANRAPIITGSPPRSVVAGQPYVFTPVASDPDGDALTFQIANRPVWASFDARSGRLSGTPGFGDVGTSSGIVISAGDGSTAAQLEAFSVNVLRAASGSSIIEWVPPTTNTDGSTLSDLAGYRIIYGTGPSSLTRSIDVTNAGVSSYLVEDLAAGTWYFAVIAFNRSGRDSAPSATVSKSIP